MRLEAVQQVLFGSDQELLTERTSETRDAEIDIQSLFYGRELAARLDSVISLGLVNDPQREVTLRPILLKRMSSSGSEGFSFVEISRDEAQSTEGEVFSAISVSYGGRLEYTRRLGVGGRSLGTLRGRRPDSFPPFLRAGTIDEDMVARWWDSVALTQSEERILSFMKVLVPIERVTLVESPLRFRTSRIFVVRVAGQRVPQPLKSLGDGVERMFRTVLALEFARRIDEGQQLDLFSDESSDQDVSRNLLLIDEVEAGIHYSAIPEYWRAIFAMAKRSEPSSVRDNSFMGLR